MTVDNMDEKTYSGQKYVNCYCEKHAKVLVGMTMFAYLNILCVPIALVLFFLFLLADIPFWAKVGFLSPLVLGCTLLPRSYYKSGKKLMLEAGHSEQCSRKIGFLAALHAGGYSNLTIMKDKDNNGKTSTLGKSRKRK